MEFKAEHKLTGQEELILVFQSIDDPKIAERVKQCYEEAYNKFCHDCAEALETLITEWKFDEEEE